MILKSQAVAKRLTNTVFIHPAGPSVEKVNAPNKSLLAKFGQNKRAN